MSALRPRAGSVLVLGLLACSRAGPSAEEGPPLAFADWMILAPMPDARTEVSVATDGARVYVLGGFAAGARGAIAPRTLWVYDPALDRWTAPDSIPAGVNHAGLAAVEGRLYLIGGYGEATFDPVGNVRIYDPARRTWQAGAPMPTPRGALALAVVDGRIHALGGTASNAGLLDPALHHPSADNSVGTHEIYDPATNTWRRAAPMPTARNHHGAAAVGGKIYVPGGRVGGNMTLTTHEIYDPAADRWTAGPTLPTGRSGIAVVALAGRVYVFGGEAQRTFDNAERFDPAVGRWERLPPMPTARHGLGAAAIGSGIYVIAGGPTPGFAFSGVNEWVRPM